LYPEHGSHPGQALRIVLMSATLDGARLAAFLDAPRLSSAGRGFPVDVAHFPARRVLRQAQSLPPTRSGDERTEAIET